MTAKVYLDKTQPEALPSARAIDEANDTNLADNIPAIMEEYHQAKSKEEADKILFENRAIISNAKNHLTENMGKGVYIADSTKLLMVIAAFGKEGEG